MTGLSAFLSQPIVERIGWALMHFVWQGAAVALLLAVALRVLRRRSPNVRYVAACLALVVMVAAPIATMLRMTPAPAMEAAAEPLPFALPEIAEPAPVAAPPIALHEEPALPEPSPVSLPIPSPASRLWWERAFEVLEASLPWIVIGWVIGVTLLSIRLLAGWMRVQRVRRSGARAAPDRLQETIKRLSHRLRISRPVRLLESALAQAPIAIGWLRPVILLPASAMTRLTPDQLAAILAHELAHIRRYDYLVNLFQSVVETLLFYHPAVHWVSYRIRAERENCCDDLAVAACGDSMTYARALTELAELRQAEIPLAVSAGGGRLLNRIRRVVGLPERDTVGRAGWLAATLILAALITSAVIIYGRTAGDAQKPITQTSALESEEPAWGEPVEGVQVRLRADKTVWEAGEVPTFKVDVRNEGPHEMTLCPTQEKCEVEFDGEWYRWSGVSAYSPKAVPKGGMAEGIVISLLDTWQRKNDNSVAAIRRTGSRPLPLTPGRHTVRVACQPEYRKSARKRQVVRVVSNEVQIEILSGKPPADEWGPAVEGVQCRLQAEKPVWNAGEVPMVLASMRNSGEREFSVTPVQVVYELEFDGAWYRWADPVELNIIVWPLSPGGRVNGIRFSLDNRWANKKTAARLNVSPGSHKVRVALTADPIRARAGRRVRAISNPVEITVLAPNHEASKPHPSGSTPEPVSGLAGKGPEAKNSMSSDTVSGARRLFGKIIDTEGRPITDARVSAWTYTARHLLNPAMANTQTHDNGRFDMTVPFPDVWYTLEVRKSGYVSETPNVLGADGREITVVLRASSQPSRVLAGSVSDVETGVPVPDAQVLLIGEHGFRGDVRTNEDGRFEMPGVPHNIGQAVLFAKAAGRISPLRLIRGSDRRVEVVLGDPARLEGIVTDELSGKPLGGCTVTARPPFVSDFSLQTTTGDDGTFGFTEVPPGKYQVGASSEQYYEPPTSGDRLERAEIPLKPGRTGFLQIAMRRMATVEGRVLTSDGGPATDAVVGMRALWEMDTSKQWRITRTDDLGRFILRTGRLHQRENIEAFSSRHGIGSCIVENLTEGETRGKVTIRLSGTARVRGVVTNPSGAPIQGIRVSASWISGWGPSSDAEGRFDLGRIPLPTASREDPCIRLMAPRPHRGDLHLWRDDGSRLPARMPEPSARFFHHRQLAFEAKHDEDLTLDVILEPAALVTFTGKVLDHRGAPVPKADVILFAGNAGSKSWKRDLHPEQYAFNSPSSDTFRQDTPLCRTIADDTGQWTMCVVRETAEGLKLLSHGMASDASRFSLGAEGPAGASALVRDIVLEKGQVQRQLDIRLGAGPAEGMISGQVVDAEGRPLAGIRFQTDAAFRTFVTGPEGRFSFRDIGSDTETVILRTKGWGVLSPEPDRFWRGFKWERATSGTQDVGVVLGRTGTVVGTARWDGGRPVVSFEVSGPDCRLSVRNAEGAFRLEEFPPGSHRINIRTPEGIRGHVVVELKPGGSTEANLVLPAADCTIRGQVTDIAGAPVSGVTVELSSNACDTNALLPDEDGRFAFKVPAGSYRLRPRPHGRLSSRAPEPTTVVVGGDRKEAEVSLVVSARRSGGLRLRLIDKEDRPLSGVKVNSASRTYATDADGWCVVRGLTPKRHIFWVSDEKLLRNERMRLTVEIEGGKTTTREIRLGEGLRVSGRVMCGPEPASNIHVWMSTEDERRKSAAHTEADGRFQFINLPEGRLAIKCTPYATNQPVTASLDLQGDVDDLVIQLPTGRILGRVLDYRGRPLLGHHVRVTCLDEPHGDLRQFTRHCEDGKLNLKYVKDGRYLLELMEGRAVLATYGPVTISDGKTLSDVVIQEPGETSQGQRVPATQPTGSTPEPAEKLKKQPQPSEKYDPKALEAEVAKETIEECVRNLLEKTLMLGSPAIIYAMQPERYIEDLQKNPRVRKLLRIATRGSASDKELLLETIKRMCRVYLEELPDCTGPGEPWKPSACFAEGVWGYVYLLTVLDETGETLPLILSMRDRHHSARRNHVEKYTGRVVSGYVYDDPGIVLAYACEHFLNLHASRKDQTGNVTSDQIEVLKAFKAYQDRRSERQWDWSREQKAILEHAARFVEAAKGRRATPQPSSSSPEPAEKDIQSTKSVRTGLVRDKVNWNENATSLVLNKSALTKLGDDAWPAWKAKGMIWPSDADRRSAEVVPENETVAECVGWLNKLLNEDCLPQGFHKHLLAHEGVGRVQKGVGTRATVRCVSGPFRQRSVCDSDTGESF